VCNIVKTLYKVKIEIFTLKNSLLRESRTIETNMEFEEVMTTDKLNDYIEFWLSNILNKKVTFEIISIEECVYIDGNKFIPIPIK